jgi:3-hydroxy acid dehydrogenase/malonic semialdehyde reductase
MGFKSLNGKTVVITGASSGIGEACVHAFAAENCRLVLLARRVDRLEKLAEEIKQQYKVEVLTAQHDVRDYQATEKFFKHLDSKWSDIDILINSAGLAAGADKFQNADLTDWEAMLDTNVKGLLYVTKSVLPIMLRRNSGHIINLGSVAGHEVYPGGSVYCASKHAVDAITKGLKMDLLGSNIRVSTVDPGMVETEFSVVRFKGDAEKAKSIYHGLTPLTPADIADAILYCASRPAHVNINEIILMPTAQASAQNVHRNKD